MFARWPGDLIQARWIWRRGGEPAGAPGDVLAERPAAGAARVAGAADAVDHRRPARRRVVEEVGVDHVRGVALGGAAQARVLAQPRQAVAGALGVVQAQDGAAHDFEVGAGRLDVGVGAALRLGARGCEQRDEREQAQQGPAPCEEGGTETRLLPPGA